MESTQNKIYEIEEQESKPIFKNNQQAAASNEADLDTKSDYGDKNDFTVGGETSAIN